ncbi:hypothetical protein P280DRAFT_491132 [Massarina eburnea CBS 473.64]|uniref:Phosphatidate phosphatase APP1 catalytic domain-containing protein n=1 Tax=Massarina eburnea CBS 473.64 TaxID=1395130 RepID=A0A6A6RZ74_9PLEO|nr:hypothetical protein P280DRAFT_491132 [Massarina eburnea CBS 473.64]
MFKTRWISPPKPVTESFEDRTIIVTGATSGIGLEAVAKFATLGAARVIIAARSLEKGESTKAAIEKRVGRKDVLEVWELDMNSFESVVAFAKRAESLPRLDIAILNAGTHKAKYSKSRDGWEEDLQVNTLASTLLAILLLPKLKSSKHITGRTTVLEFVNSGLHQNAIVSPEIQKEPNVIEWYNKPENFKEGVQYSYTKMFLMHVASKLAGEVSSEEVIITSICPGLVRTDLGRDHYFPGIGMLFAIAGLLIMNSAAVGANPILSGTVQGEMAHGRFWKDDRIMPIAPSLAGDSNKKLGLRIWGEIVEPSTHGTSSFLRYLFPHSSQRARAHLHKFRHETLPAFKHRTQSRIYRYILYRQAQKLKNQPGLLQRLRGSTRKLLGSSYLDNEARTRQQKLTHGPKSDENTSRAMSYYQDSYAPREPGARRKKLAGYLKAANELRQSYQQAYAPGWSRSEASYDYEDDTPGSFPDAAIVRSGDEEMVLFPSYARKHIKRKPEPEPGTMQAASGEGRNVRDSGGGDADFWKQQWDNYEDDNAVVDVDVRGWIYSPHRGQMSRKQRLFVGLARQLVGIQAPPAGARPSSASGSTRSSREPSPGAQTRQSQRDEQAAAKEADQILRKGEREAEAAAKGAYSERPAAEDSDNRTEYRTENPGHPRVRELSKSPSATSLKSDDNIKPLQKRSSWTQPADMDAAELAEANARLMARLRHFLAIPMANTPISVFFYNDQASKQRTIYTNPSGHFSISAALDFIPTHVRILASDRLSATEEVVVTDSNGISVISDIDDTIKHSAISSGAREIFRNAFIRDLGDLTIDGVREWYNKMAELGVKFHYVSNSPWQLYPVISKYFSLAGLPPGSFHLKQYSGMLQGIFEPVAERKKSTLDKIARDFPERRFILIGDSGEADLEVYTDFVLENPGRAVAVFIRDVTTTESSGFFDPSVGSLPDRSSSSSQRGSGNSSNLQASSEEEDPEFKAAIAASLRHLEEEENKRSRSLLPQLDQDHPATRPGLPMRRPQTSAGPEPVGDLIDLSDEKSESATTIRPPSRPTSRPTIRREPSTQSTSSKPPTAPKPNLDQQTYAGMARDSLTSVYNNLPSLSSQPDQPTSSTPGLGDTSQQGAKKIPPPPPPPRRGITSYPGQAASYVGTKASNAWQYTTPPVPPQNTRPTQAPSQPYSTTSAPQGPQRTNTSSTLGTSGGWGNGGGGYGENGQMSKREMLWRQRWARAEQVLTDRGVMLRSWRVGSDAVAEADQLIKRCAEKDARGGRR